MRLRWRYPQLACGETEDVPLSHCPVADRVVCRAGGPDIPQRRTTRRIDPVADVGYPAFWADDFISRPPTRASRDSLVGFYSDYISTARSMWMIGSSSRFYARSGDAPALTPLFEVATEDVDRVMWLRNGARAGESIYLYSAYLATPLDLAADTTYYLSVANNIYLDTGIVWCWPEHHYRVGNTFGRTSLDDPWLIDVHELEMPFYLTGGQTPIPEPASLVLVGMGLLGLYVRRRGARS